MKPTENRKTHFQSSVLRLLSLRAEKTRWKFFPPRTQCPILQSAVDQLRSASFTYIALISRLAVTALNQITSKLMGEYWWNLEYIFIVHRFQFLSTKNGKKINGIHKIWNKLIWVLNFSASCFRNFDLYTFMKAYHEYLSTLNSKKYIYKQYI